VHLRALLAQPDGQQVGLAALPFILERANQEIQGVLANLRDSRSALETATVEKGQNIRDLMREEIFGMMGCLQFQDITTQQLAYASSVLTDMEGRLLQIAKLFDPATVMVQAVVLSPDPRTFDPRATTKNADQRQAVADEIFR
jgi:hypothetical protein